jgi:hypothetical protein
MSAKCWQIQDLFGFERKLVEDEDITLDKEGHSDFETTGNRTPP